MTAVDVLYVRTSAALSPVQSPSVVLEACVSVGPTLVSGLKLLF